MDNGCVCCTVHGDLVNAFKSFSARADKYDAVMIETTTETLGGGGSIILEGGLELGVNILWAHLPDSLTQVFQLTVLFVVCHCSRLVAAWGGMPPGPTGQEAPTRGWQ